MIFNIEQQKPLPVYGKGENVRDWLWVGDHVSAIDQIFHHGAIGHTYNIGGNNEWQNIELVRLICRLMDEALNRPAGTAEALITYVKDRPGHDLRYAIDASKIAQSLGWTPSMPFEDGLRQTIGWYLSNDEWTAHIRSGAYQRYYEQQYGQG
jgi:dTDP-glucose 4,6-dehydratase